MNLSNSIVENINVEHKKLSNKANSEEAAPKKLTKHAYFSHLKRVYGQFSKKHTDALHINRLLVLKQNRYKYNKWDVVI